MAFDSYLSDLVPGDTNNANDIFVYELDTGLTERINVKTDGSQAADGMSLAPSISENGRYVAFESSSDGLVSGDQNGLWNIFVRDRLNGSTEMVDINDQGVTANMRSGYARISPNGRYVTFLSTATNLDCAATQTPKIWIFTHDRESSHTWLASTPDDGQPTTEDAAFSVVDNLGRTLYFSQARDVDGYLPGQNGFYLSTAVNPQRLCGNFDLKVAPVDDLPTPDMPEPIRAGRGSLTRLTSTQLQASDPDSPPEQIVYTLTGAPAHGALVKGGARMALGEYFTQADLDAGRMSYWNDGSQVDSDGLDLTLSNVGPVMEYVSRANNGTPANAMSAHNVSVSADSRYVAFSSLASLVSDDTNNNYDVFVRDLLNQTTERISIGWDGTEANGASGVATLSSDGRWVAFVSEASNLVEGDTNGIWDYFTYDRLTGATRRVSVSSSGEQADQNIAYPYPPTISADGRFVAFSSDAGNLVPNDVNGAEDVFVFDQLMGTIELISATTDGYAGNSWSRKPSISADGRWVAFESQADDLAPGVPNPDSDVFVFDRAARQMKRLFVDPSNPYTGSYSPAVSADGQTIGYLANPHFVPPQPTVYKALFLYNLVTDQTRLVGPVTNNVYSFSLSVDGRYAAIMINGGDGQIDLIDTLTQQTWRVSNNPEGVPCSFVYDRMNLSANAALTAFYCAGMHLPSDPQTLVGVFAYRGTGPILHLDVQVDLSWQTIFLPSVNR